MAVSAVRVADQAYEGVTAGGTAVLSLRLRDFRNYADLHLRLSGGPVVLTGPNGAGKTNILEALSFLSPGRGLRRAKLSDVSRSDCTGAGWVAHADLASCVGPVSVGTGLAEAGEDDGAERRVVRINGEAASSANGLVEYLDVAWLTPQMDRLFVEGLSTRRRFMDRLVYGLDGGHARQVAAYEKAMRERNRLLKNASSVSGADAVWLAALESQMAEHGVAVAAARRDGLARIEAGMALASGPFPKARLAAQGTVETWLTEMPALAVEERVRKLLAEKRGIDRDAGAATEGPHRSDMAVWHADKDQPAAQCSTGEQKALLIAITLANARLIRARRGIAPLMLLDEVSAHLDVTRRTALYEELLSLGGQVWLTGTDEDLFAGLAGQAEFFTVSDGVVTPRAVI
ncbi:DNA replication/repair protein RecF [Ferrovibrio sp.]|uniref:DNA replication/repair protein RecF n=1 Tax=Ferrovibrio sp. TaxID=1917215 RepID=UPI000CBF143E|nr:DNA replication/repair protein RecF [Ferrovibrio sp.]PJI39157.1 MAG: DNA replication/repair protein RecF [Ferrovibrio sp.]